MRFAVLTIGVFAGHVATAQTTDADPAIEEDAIFECTADGYEVLIRNISPDIVPEGSVIAWEVPFVRKSGVHELDEDFAPDESFFISGALGSDYLSAPQPCDAALRDGSY